MTGLPRNVFNWEELPLDIKKNIFDKSFEIQPGAREPNELEAFRGTKWWGDAKTIYEQKNRIMTPDSLETWNSLTLHQLRNTRHLYILLEDDADDGPDSVSLLQDNPLKASNCLESITLDLTCFDLSNVSDFHRKWTQLPSILITLIKASNGCVGKVSVLFGPAGCHTERTVHRGLSKLLQSAPTTSVRYSGERLILP
ncbi:hypothetical protein EG329_012162 [Mollisiaceae sp. DMI_Dod_QoI]|nr:hypothetical protein EG329_012162 [Helotiales sp. DMI_Dod_QoI]